jgi:putative flippase GtrA
MAVNFTLSRRLVFGQQGRIGRGQVLRFFLISLSTLVLRVVVAFAAMAILSLPPFAGLASLPIDAPATRLAHVVAMGLVTIYSFFAHKHISFAAPPSPPASMAVR